jgi:hypothetical protein
MADSGLTLVTVFALPRFRSHCVRHALEHGTSRFTSGSSPEARSG